METAKILFISDLDGTLLTPDCKITDETAKILNNLIKSGLIFSIATARTIATVKKLTEKINISMPVVLMNGVIIYDINTSKYVDIEEIPKNSINCFFEKLEEYGSKGFLYTIENNTMQTYYVNCSTPNAQGFIEERIIKYGKIFTKIKNFVEILNRKIVYYSISDLEEKLRPLYDEIKNLEGLHIEFYRDIYNENFWYLEACSEKASKYNAIMKLRELYGFDRVVCFGDNLNDIPMFNASDYSCAVENAREQVKNQANKIIGANYDNGVAKFLLNIFKNK